jgi:hypothetical protein
MKKAQTPDTNSKHFIKTPALFDTRTSFAKRLEFSPLRQVISNDRSEAEA